MHGSRHATHIALNVHAYCIDWLLAIILCALTFPIQYRNKFPSWISNESSVWLWLMHGDNLAIWCYSKCRECITLSEWVPSTLKDGDRLSTPLQQVLPPPVSILSCKLWWMSVCYIKRAPLFFSLPKSNGITWLTSSLMWKKWNLLVERWLHKTRRLIDVTASQWTLHPGGFNVTLAPYISCVLSSLSVILTQPFHLMKLQKMPLCFRDGKYIVV